MNLDDLLMNSPEEYNPFEPPELIVDPAIESSLHPWRLVIRRFGQESRALAGVAIFFAFVTALMTFVVSLRFGKFDGRLLVAGMFGVVFTGGLLVVGLQIARKKMVAVRVLMALAYALLAVIAGHLLYFGTTSLMFAVFAAMIPGFVAAQCHRVIGYARTMAAAGIPLHTKPHEITLNHLTPNSDQPSYRV